ncbi:MAG: citrate/2-methylcitrate synthase [bacterium]|nr:citrate/2-methylcitrate synthase [bacterium]
MTTLRTLSPAFDWRTNRLEWPVTTEVGPGLSGVLSTTTEVTWLDPASGSLSYRGRPVETMALEHDFEEVAFLLITGSDPGDSGESLQEFRDSLRASRRLPPEVISLIRDIGPETHPTRLLRAGVSALGCHEITVDDDLSGERHWRELRIVGQMAALVGQIAANQRGGSSSTVPANDTGLAAGLLAALHGHEVEAEDVRLLDLLWVLYAAHGLDAPTFTSMVVASCLADPYFNMVAGLSALRGPRQGGAIEAVMNQFRGLDDPAKAESHVEGILASGGKVAGFGHRSYRMPDPRAAVLRRELAAIARRRRCPEIFEIARALETAATTALAPRGVHININFYAAPIFSLLGAEASLVPCLYAVGRTAGMVALVREAMEGTRLVRPLSRYVGPGERHLNPIEPP